MTPFRFDVFISYAHLDDLPIDGSRWITRLQGILAGFLSRPLGRKANIWRDVEQLGTDSDFEQEIYRGLRESATLVTVVTQVFLKREWFTKEYQEFLRNQRLTVTDIGRVFVVYPIPMERSELPEYIRQFIGYDLSGDQKAFLQKANIMASEIHEAILTLGHMSTDSTG